MHSFDLMLSFILRQVIAKFAPKAFNTVKVGLI